jgi:hypothetical protein
VDMICIRTCSGTPPAVNAASGEVSWGGVRAAILGVGSEVIVGLLLPIEDLRAVY